MFTNAVWILKLSCHLGMNLKIREEEARDCYEKLKRKLFLQIFFNETCFEKCSFKIEIAKVT